MDYEKMWWKARHMAEDMEDRTLLAEMEEIEESWFSSEPTTFVPPAPFFSMWFRLRRSAVGKRYRKLLREIEDLEMRADREQMQEYIEHIQDMFKALGGSYELGGDTGPNSGA